MAGECALCRAKVGERLVVVSVDCEPAVRRRLCDLGLTEGCGIRPLYSSVFGDPKAYLVRGSVLGIRDRDAEGILCRKEA
jgi:ferrous iron transport protein A